MKNKIKTNKTSLKTSNRVSVDVNDVFEEITDQNKELREQIKLLVEFKQFFDKIIDKLKLHLNDSELNELKTFDHKLDRVFRSDVPLNEKINIKVEPDYLMSSETNGFRCEDNENRDKIDFKFNPSLRQKYRLKTKKKTHNKKMTEQLLKLREKYTKQKKSTRLEANLNLDITRVKLKRPLGPGEDLNEVCGYDNCTKVFRKYHHYIEHMFEKHRVLDERSRRTVHRCDWPGCDYMSLKSDRYKVHVQGHQGDITKI